MIEDGKISAFPGVALLGAPVTEQPCRQVVEFLEEVLADAKLGKIQAIAVAYVGPNDITSDGFAHGKYGGHALFAAISDLFYSTAHSRWERGTLRRDAE